MISKLLLALGANNPKRYLRSAGWITFTKFLSIAISLSATFYIARNLGPQNFGELNYAISLVNLLAFFGAIASSIVICRDLVKDPSQQKTILGTAWLLTFLGTFITIILVIILTLFLPHDHVTLYIVGILCLAQLCSTFQVSQYIFYAKAETKSLSLAQLTIHIFVSLAKIVAMVQGQGVIVLAGIMFFEQFFSAIIMTTLYYRHTKFFPTEWTFNIAYAKKIAFDSIPFVFISMSVVVSGRIDQIFIKQFFDATAVGFYSVAVQFTEMFQVLPQILLSSLFPALVNSHTSQNSYNKRILALIILIGLYSFTASLLTYLLAPALVPLIYGTAFSASISLLQIYTWSLFGIVAGFLITNILVTENQRRIQIIVGFLPMVLNIILNIIWIPQYGTVGAAWATVISYSTAPLIPFFFRSIRAKFFLKIK